MMIRLYDIYEHVSVYCRHDTITRVSASENHYGAKSVVTFSDGKSICTEREAHEIVSEIEKANAAEAAA